MRPPDLIAMAELDGPLSSSSSLGDDVVSESPPQQYASLNVTVEGWRSTFAHKSHPADYSSAVTSSRFLRDTMNRRISVSVASMAPKASIST